MGMHIKIIMNSHICTNDFEISPRHLKENKWCSYCSSKKVCREMSCYDKTFVSSNNEGNRCKIYFKMSCM